MTELEQLWELLPHPRGSVVRWFARSGGRRIGEFACNLRELEAAAQQATGMNFYVQPNPTFSKTGVRCTANDITHWSWLFLDIDPVTEECRPDLALKEHLLWLGEWTECALAPLVIDSGRGYQAWVRLDDERLDDASRKQARQSMSYWLKKLDVHHGVLHGCRLDTSCSDLPRVMRCPGTANLKTGRVARIIERGVMHSGLAYRLLMRTPPKVFEEPEQGQVAVGMAWQIARPLFTKTAKDYTENGAEEGGRHKAACATARSMRDVGLSSEEALKGLRQGNTRSPEPLDPADLKRIVADTYSTQ